MSCLLHYGLGNAIISLLCFSFSPATEGQMLLERSKERLVLVLIPLSHLFSKGHVLAKRKKNLLLFQHPDLLIMEKAENMVS